MHKLGVLIGVSGTTNVPEKMKRAKEIGCECCQICIWDPADYTEEKAEEILAAAKESGLEISTLWAGWSGPSVWDFTQGPSTLGIVPEAFRMKRAEELLQGVAFAARLGVPRVATHAGFLPENKNDPRFDDVVAILRYIVRECEEKGVSFLFETGQETPVALLRIIQAIGSENVGINLDTANLILYGKANTADAVTVFGKYVMDTHIKDGLYPTDGNRLGKEVALGEGMANIKEVIRRLLAAGYTGNFIVEREIGGEQQTKDVIKALAILREALAELGA